MSEVRYCFCGHEEPDHVTVTITGLYEEPVSVQMCRWCFESDDEELADPIHVFDASNP